MNATFTVWQSPAGAHVRADFNTLVEAESAALQFQALPELWAIIERLAENKSGEVIVYNNLRAEARVAIAKAKGEA